MASENVLLAREQTRLLGEILAELQRTTRTDWIARAREEQGWMLALARADDGLPVTPNLEGAISASFHALGIERVGGRVAAVTLAVRQYLGELSKEERS